MNLNGNSKFPNLAKNKIGLKAKSIQLKESKEKYNEKRRNEAAEYKNKLNLLLQNNKTLQESIVEENQQQRRVIKTQELIAFNSIINYKQEKANYIGSMAVDKLKSEMELMSSKQFDLKELKKKYAIEKGKRGKEDM